MVTPSWGSFPSPKTMNNVKEQPEKNNEKQELDQELQGKVADEEKPESEKPKWGNFKSTETYQGDEDPNADEGIFDSIIRHSTRTASRVVEQVAGRYGNIEKFAKDTLVSLPKSGGAISWALSELLGPEKWERMVRGPKGQEQMLPTSKQIKDLSESISGGYTKSMNKKEKAVDEFFEDVGSTISTRPQTVAGTAINNILVPAAANAAKQVVKETGFGENTSNLAKIAVWLPLSLAANVNAPCYASNLMNYGRTGYGPNVNASVPRYQSKIDSVSREMFHGDPRSSLAQTQLVGLRDDLATGKTSIRDLMTRYDAINAAKRDRGLFQLGRSDRESAIRNINQVRDVVRGEIEILGQANPEALRSWQNGVQAWAVIHTSRALSNRVESIVKGPYGKALGVTGLSLFGVGSAAAGLKSAVVAAPVSAASAGLYKTGQTLYRMWNDPRLASYYWNAIGAAQSENIPAFINNYNKLNDELDKKESISVKKRTSKKKK